MSDFSSQDQKRNGRGHHPNSIAAGTANLIPYKPGQSGNPGGRPRGTPRLSNIYARLLRLSPAELAQFQPQSAAEAMALRQVVAAIYGVDALPAVKEITDRTEGKAIQRKADVSESEIVAAARRDYALGLQLLGKLAEALTASVFCADCAAKLETVMAQEDVAAAILATTDERYHDAVIREFEAMADEPII